MYSWPVIQGNVNGEINGQNSECLTTPNAGEDVKQQEPLDAAGGKVEWYSQYAKQYGGSSKNKN